MKQLQQKATTYLETHLKYRVPELSRRGYRLYPFCIANEGRRA